VYFVALQRWRASALARLVNTFFTFGLRVRWVNHIVRANNGIVCAKVCGEGVIDVDELRRCTVSHGKPKDQSLNLPLNAICFFFPLAGAQCNVFSATSVGFTILSLFALVRSTQPLRCCSEF
jgi:hypothetical protein